MYAFEHETAQSREALGVMPSSDLLLDVVDRSARGKDRLSYQVFAQHALPSLNTLAETKFVIHFRSNHAEKCYLGGSNVSENLTELFKIAAKYPTAATMGGNVFDGVIQKVLPTLDEVELFPMTTESIPEDTTKFVQYYPDQSARATRDCIKVKFARNLVCPFTSSCPPLPEETYYYEGGTTTPLIDGFFLSNKDGGEITVYFIQISTSLKKESRCSSRGLLLVEEIISAVSLTSHLAVRIAFVLVVPKGVHEQESVPTWAIPRMKGFCDLQVYQCYVAIPDNVKFVC